MMIFDTSNLRGDIYGGLTAGVVALPLALAFGEASGAGALAGLWGAIILGFFAALFGGTGSQISGPTGPMVVVFAGLYESLAGYPALIFATVVLAGLLQILFGLLRFGQYIRLVPYPVISGFMSGIGCIIILLQVARLFGHEPDGGGTINALRSIPGAVSQTNMSALTVGMVTLAVVFSWPRSWGRYIPGVLAALIAGTTLSLVVTGAPVLGNIPRGFPSFVVPGLTAGTSLVVLQAAFILAALGAIDSLLTSLVADNVTQTRHHSDKELIGQGIGNTIAGFFGAVPGAGATMRTVVNIRTGGKTKISGMVHALVLLAIVISLAPLAAVIPQAVLAGILVKVGYDIIDFVYLKRAHKGPRWDLVLMALVLGLTVFVDLITAVVVGVMLAALAFVKKTGDSQIAAFRAPPPKHMPTEERALLDAADGHVILFDFGGPLSFGAAADLGHHARELSSDKSSAVVLDFSRVPFIDLSAALAVETIISDADDAGRMVYATGMNTDVRGVLDSFSDAHRLADEVCFEHRIDALRAALDGKGKR
jgi:SulP family sulfate permease